MAKQTVAERYVDLMFRAGARRRYGVAGDSLSPVVEAVRRHRTVKWAQVRQGEVAVEGYTQVFRSEAGWSPIRWGSPAHSCTRTGGVRPGVGRPGAGDA